MDTKTYPCAVETKIPGLAIVDRGPQYPGKRYLARAWDKETRKHKNKAKDRISDCEAWATTTIAEFTTGIDRAGQVLLKDVVKEWLLSKEARGNDKESIQEQRRLMNKAMKAGISNLKSPSIIRDTQRFLVGLKSDVPVGRKQMKDGVEVPRKMRELSDPTRRRFVMHFRDLGNFCAHASRRWLTYNPFQAVEAPTLPDTIMPVFNLDECRRFVSPQALCLPEGLYWAFRLYSGMRLQECAKARWDHIKWDAHRIYVKLEFGKKIKRNKERLLILEEELVDLLKKKGTVQGEYIFSDAIRLRHRKKDGLAFRAHCERLGITIGDRCPHSLRGTNASLLLAAGLDAIGLMDHLGHSTMTMSRKYSRASQFFREACRGWGGRIRLRQECSKSAATGVRNGTESVQAVTSEDELDDCEIVILPSKSPVFTAISSSNSPIRSDRLVPGTPALGSSVERRVGSSPSVRNPFEEQDLYGDGEGILRYGSE